MPENRDHDQWRHVTGPDALEQKLGGGHQFSDPHVFGWGILGAREAQAPTRQAGVRRETLTRDQRVHEIMTNHCPANADLATQNSIYARINRLAGRFRMRNRKEQPNL